MKPISGDQEEIGGKVSEWYLSSSYQCGRNFEDKNNVVQLTIPEKGMN